MEYAGIVHQHIHAAKTIARSVDDTIGIGRGRDVASEEAYARRLGEPVGRDAELGLGAAVDKYVGAATDELLGDSLTDSRRSASDDDGLMICVFHDRSPLFC
jgi:hypothetical protein